MKAIVRNLNDITDSREMLEAKTHPFITIFIVGLTIIIFGALLWSYYGEIDINIKANGVVRPNEKISSIKNKVAGKVKRVNYNPGQKIKTGELLYSIESSDLEIQKDALSEDLAKTEKDLTELIRFKAYLLNNTNGNVKEAKANDPSYFLEDYTASQKIEVELIGLINKISETNQTIGKLELLEQSIVRGTNLFSPNDGENFNKYEDYVFKLKKIEVQKRNTIIDFKNKMGETDLDASKQQLEDMQLNVDDYANGYMLSLRTGLEGSRKQLKELEASRAQIYLELNQSIETNQNIIKSIKDKLSAYSLNLKNYQVKAPVDGIINSITEIKTDDLLDAGTEILSIIPENNSEYTVQLYLPNKDVADIKVGDPIKFQFQALPYKEYGELTGKVQLIAADATVDQQSGGSYYRVEASIENRPLYSRKGEVAHIKVGMTSQAHIITSTKKILYYLLEKLDLKE